MLEADGGIKMCDGSGDTQCVTLGSIQNEMEFFTMGAESKDLERFVSLRKVFLEAVKKLDEAIEIFKAEKDPL